MSDQTPVQIPSYPSLWFTSGTPHRLGQRSCAYERWLGYHAGRHGTGFRRRATAVPLATGSGVHVGVGLLVRWVLDWQGAHPRQRLARSEGGGVGKGCG